MDVREFPAKVKGMLSDHAEDQRKLVRLFKDWKFVCEREVRGERALAILPPSDVLHHLSVMMDDLIVTTGGPQVWDTLSMGERQIRADEAIHQLRIKVGEETFAALSDTEKESIDFFIWAGCCMHKELNAAKGGNTKMRSWWGQKGIEGPVLLMNKDNTANAALGSSKGKERAVTMSTGGAQKVLDLAGSVFRNKDDKRGQQDSFRYYFEAELGNSVQWPDTSNTRYHSHGDAACEFLVHEPLYITYLEVMKSKKESRTLTNIEENVLRGFSCTKTKEEITCFAVYNQCITHPYLRMVRNTSLNILDLGPVHVQLINHLQCLIMDVNIILGPDASYKAATLDKHPFERPEAVYTIQRAAQDTTTYPHLRQLLVQFLQGAQETWVRFTAEFSPGGSIDKSTTLQRRHAFMNTTNDCNEGALGSMRTTLRRAPHMSLNYFNSSFMYKKNETSTYVSTVLGTDDWMRLRRKAREMEGQHNEHQRRKAQAEYDCEVVRRNREQDARRQEKRDATEAKFAAFEPCTSIPALRSLRVVDIDFQLRWHRWFDSSIPASKDMPKTKAEKISVLQQAIGRYIRHEVVEGNTSKPGAQPEETGDDNDDDL